MRSWLYLFLAIIFAFTLSACSEDGASSSGKASSEKAETVLWLMKSSNEDENLSDLYAKYGKADIEKIASDVVTGSHVTYGNGEKILFLDSEQQLYYIEKGKEKEKVGSDTMDGSYEFSKDGQAIFYLTSDNGLYMKKLEEDRTKLASEVSDYTLASDEQSLYVLDQEGTLEKIVIEDEAETTIASDVVSYTVARNGLIYTNEDGMLYKVNEKEEKEKVSKTEVVYPDVSSDADVITYLEEYNIEKGYGELYVQTSKEEREKVASDIKMQSISGDGSKIYYITSDDVFYAYTIKSEEKIKIGTDVADYRIQDDLIVYLTNEHSLYEKSGKDEKKQLNADTEEYGILNDGTIYYLTKDKDVFLYNKGEEKKVLSDIENLYVSANYIYYLTTENNIGVLTIGQDKPDVLVENAKEYPIIYTDGYLLYQDQLKLKELQGYWFNAANDLFVSFDQVKEETARLNFFYRSYEDSSTVTLSSAYANVLFANDDTDQIKIKLVNPKTIELTVNDTEAYIMTKSNENALIKVRGESAAANAAMNMDTDYEEEYESYEDSSLAENYETNKEGIKATVMSYGELLVDAINYNDFSLVAPTLVPDSNLYTMQKKLVQNLNKKGITEELLTFNVLHVAEGDQSGEYEVSTYEQAEIIQADGSVDVKDYYWTYTVIDQGRGFGLTDIKETK